MKKLFVLLLVITIACQVLPGQSLKAGGGAGLSTGFPFYNLPESYNKSGKAGIVFKGIYKTGKPLSFSPSITYFIPHISRLSLPLEERKIIINGFMFDFNGHYVLISSGQLEVYGLTGFDIFLASKKEVIKYSADPVTHSTGTYTSRLNDNGLGFNVGAGLTLNISEKIDFYAEARYLLFTKFKLFFSSYNQALISAGLLFRMNIQKNTQATGN
jgi:hypothetical protein